MEEQRVRQEPTYEQLKERLRLSNGKSNRRKAALKQLMKAHLGLKWAYDKACIDRASLYEEVCDLEHDLAELEIQEDKKEESIWDRVSRQFGQ